MSRQSTAALLQEAAHKLGREADLLKGSCALQGEEWACADCNPSTCPSRTEYAALMDLHRRLTERANEIGEAA